MNTDYAVFPSANYADYLKSVASFRGRFTYNKSFVKPELTTERIRKNVAALNVYFSSMNLHVYSEKAQMDFNSLLSNVGGQIGLFLGVSWLTFFELIDFVFLFGQVAVLYVKRRISRPREQKYKPSDTSTL